MKKLNNIILAIVSLLAFAPIMRAQNTIADICGELEFGDEFNETHIGNGVGYLKNISEPTSNGTYWIKLEAFATGEGTVVNSSVPSDIILLLDVSSSMDQSTYTYHGQSMQRWEALRAAVVDFVKTIYDNDAECRAVDTEYAGNRIAIVTYCRTSKIINGGWQYINQVVQKDENNNYSGSLLNTINQNNKNGVWAHYENGGGDRNTSGTRPDRALRLTIDQLLDGNPAEPREGANLTVLLFTDGYPTDSYGTHWGEPTTTGDMPDSGNYMQSAQKFDWPFANKALYYASVVKQSYDASLYTVGLISEVPRPDTVAGRTNTDGGNGNTYGNAWKWRNYCRVRQMMEWMSSEYPNSGWDFTGVSATDRDYDIDDPFNGTDVNNIHTGTDIPAIWRTEWKYNDGGNNGTDYITLEKFVPGSPQPEPEDPEEEKIQYSTIVSDNQSFDTIFEYISSQSGGTPVELDAASSTVDVVSSSFVLAGAANKSEIKLFTAKCTGTKNNPVYDFGTESYVGTSPYYSFDEDGNVTEVKVDANLDVNVSGDNNNIIEVTGFEYSNNWCGPIKTGNTITGFQQGYKVIIMIPVKMNPDAVGGPNVSTNTTGSGIYEHYDPEDPNNKPLVEFESPHVSLPVNVYIEKVGLEGRESAKFKIERAEIPDGEWTIASIKNWEYVSTVYVTNSPTTEKTPIKTVDGKTTGGNPMVRVKGMPASKIVAWKNAAGEQVATRDANHTIPVQVGLIYKISEEDWSWSYEGKTDPQYTVTDKVDNPFTFKNEKEEHIDVDVRHAESKVTNIFKKGTDRRYDDSKTNEGRETSGPQGLNP